MILSVRGANKMTKILVLYHSMTGNTEKMAAAVTEDAKGVEGVDVELRRVSDVLVEDLAYASGYAFEAPNTFGGMAGEMKTFFERAWKVRAKMDGKPAVGFNSENPGAMEALNDIDRFITIFKLEKLSEGVVAAKTPSEETIKVCRMLGCRVGG